MSKINALFLGRRLLPPLMIFLSSCGGGGSTQATVPLSADQQTFEAVQSDGGQAGMSFSIPVKGGVLQSPANFVLALYTSTLQGSPAVSGPQLVPRNAVSLAADLALPAPAVTRVLDDGHVLTSSNRGSVRFSYVGDVVQRDTLADDGQTVLWSEQYSGYSVHPLSGPLVSSPAQFLGTLPLQNWEHGGNLSPGAAWNAGAAYVTRKGHYTTDAVYAQACDTVDSSVPNSPCAGAATVLEDAFPQVLLSGAAPGRPYEADFFADGTIATLDGVRMWIANAPLPLAATVVQRYRVFYELDGAIYMGAMQKAGSAVYTQQPNGSVVDYITTLNRQAVESVSAALIVQGAGGDGVASADIAGPMVDQFGLGAQGVNGSLSPADLRMHYNVPPTATGAGQTVAIVAAPGTANVLADLNAFSRYYGLPECGATNPCFEEIDLPGQTPNAATAPWTTETAIDVEMIHSIAPSAKIVLVVAIDPSHLFHALQYASALPGVTAVSMSFGGTEFPGQLDDDWIFAARPGVAYFASSGDSGHSAQYSASSPFVTGVGGTTINSLAWSGADSEVAWSLTGGGTSVEEAMPTWQRNYLVAKGSPPAAGAFRIVPDVAGLADNLRSGVAVFRQQAWFYAGGTSASAPMWAGISALVGEAVAGSGRSLSSLMLAEAPGGGGFTALLYKASLANAGAFHDVVSGSDDLSSTACLACSAGPGYDGLTGLGVPDVAALLQTF